MEKDPISQFYYTIVDCNILVWFGIFYGIGFCPLTEWHWQILEKLGVQNLPYSYIQYLIYRLAHVNMNPKLVEIATAIVFIIAFFASTYLNFIKGRLFIKADK